MNLTSLHKWRIHAFTSTEISINFTFLKFLEYRKGLKNHIKWKILKMIILAERKAYSHRQDRRTYLSIPHVPKYKEYHTTVPLIPFIAFILYFDKD